MQTETCNLIPVIGAIEIYMAKTCHSIVQDNSAHAYAVYRDFRNGFFFFFGLLRWIVYRSIIDRSEIVISNLPP